MRRLGGAVAAAIAVVAPSVALAASGAPPAIVPAPAAQAARRPPDRARAAPPAQRPTDRARAARAAPTPSPLARARLQGQFRLSGRVTVATRVPGEHVGDTVLRTWTFVSPCTAGPCPTIGLARTRATGIDRLLLGHRAPAYYVGHGSFSAPLLCGKQIYPAGALVPFTISVRITGTTVVNGVRIATRLSATYLNKSRINRTRCVAVLGHDAATYQGQLLVPPAPSSVTHAQRFATIRARDRGTAAAVGGAHARRRSPRTGRTADRIR